jgi:hypothetical protein
VWVCGVVLTLAAFRAVALASARRAMSLAAAAVVSILVMSALPGVLDMIGDRLSRLSMTDSSGRFTAVPRVFEAFSARPFGWGFAGHAGLGEMVHNGILIYFVTFGVFGVLIPAAWGIWIVRSWKASVALARRRDRDHSAAAALAGSLLAVQVAVWSASGIIHEPMFWALSGFALAAIGYAHREPRMTRVASGGCCAPGVNI